jgi:hypothetical protein
MEPGNKCATTEWTEIADASRKQGRKNISIDFNFLNYDKLTGCFQDVLSFRRVRLILWPIHGMELRDEKKFRQMNK